MTSEQNKLVEDGIGLVVFTIAKYFPSMKYDEDMFQVGCIGLIKAAKSFDPEKNSFSSHAVRCISGTLIHEYHRQNALKRKSFKDAVYLEEIMYHNNDGAEKSTKFIDLVSDAERFEEDSLNKLLIDKNLKKLPEIQREAIIKYFFDGMSQTQIAKVTGIRQVYISRAIKKGCATLRGLIGELA